MSTKLNDAEWIAQELSHGKYDWPDQIKERADMDLLAEGPLSRAIERYQEACDDMKLLLDELGYQR